MDLIYSVDFVMEFDIYLIKIIQKQGFSWLFLKIRWRQMSKNGMHIRCLQVKYSLFMQCVNVLFPSRRWGNEEPGERSGREYTVS